MVSRSNRKQGAAQPCAAEGGSRAQHAHAERDGGASASSALAGGAYVILPEARAWAMLHTQVARVKSGVHSHPHVHPYSRAHNARVHTHDRLAAAGGRRRKGKAGRLDPWQVAASVRPSINPQAILALLPVVEEEVRRSRFFENLLAVLALSERPAAAAAAASGSSDGENDGVVPCCSWSWAGVRQLVTYGLGSLGTGVRALAGSLGGIDFLLLLVQDPMHELFAKQRHHAHTLQGKIPATSWRSRGCLRPPTARFRAWPTLPACSTPC